MFKPNAVGGGRGLGALLQHCLRSGHPGRQVPLFWWLFKKDIAGRHQVHIDFCFRGEGGAGWTHMCRFYFYELIWSVYFQTVYVVKM
jgi:hypothetical protein